MLHQIRTGVVLSIVAATAYWPSLATRSRRWPVRRAPRRPISHSASGQPSRRQHPGRAAILPLHRLALDADDRGARRPVNYSMINTAARVITEED